MFKRNDRVELIDNPAIKGIIDSVIGGNKNDTMYRVTFTHGLTGSSLRRQDDLRLSVESDDPWENLISERFYTYDDFVLNTIYHKIQNTVDNTISSLKASKTLFKPHQFIPLIKLLKYQQMRLLIADEVGLGKTIEAGHILLELYARNMISRVLVICTKTLIPKWEDEMREKFAFPFKEVSTNQLIKDFSGGQAPEDYYGIINYDKFSANDRLKKFCKSRKLKFDLLICDEVQALRNRETERHKALKNIIYDSKAVVFLSATPINNKIEDLFNLLQLLDPVRYFESSNFENDNELNKPFIRALNQIQRNQPLGQVADELVSSSVIRRKKYGEFTQTETNPISELLQDDPLFKRVIKQMRSGNNSLENRVLIQRDLTQLNSINYLFTRTKKADVEGDSARRIPQKCLVKYTEDEWAVFERELSVIYDYYDKKYEQGSHSGGMSLPIMTRARQMASSLPAYLKDFILANFVTDSKYNKLLEIVREVVGKHQRKLIIFGEFKNTLKYLKQRLTGEGFTCALITGENPEERSDLLIKFKTDENLNILLASRVGTEGIDLQFCDAMVNYDLPWNPMVLEQRIGRLDRIGQESEVIHIYNMVVQGTIEELVYDRLLTKIRVFEESIGILESILISDDYGEAMFRELEYELYNPKLTENEREQKVEQKARSLINERENIELIQTELTDAMVQDHHFRDEINSIVRNERYVTASNLAQYIEGLIRHSFKEINILSVSNYEMVLDISKDVALRLDTYITETIRSADVNSRVQLQLLYGDFKKILINAGKLKLCFDSETAFRNPDVHYVNPYHPLIFAASKFFKDKNLYLYNAFSFKINSKQVTDFLLRPGYYILVLGELEVMKKWFGHLRKQKFLIPIVSDLNDDEIQTLPQEQAEELYRACQTRVSDVDIADPLPEEALEHIRYSAALTIDRKSKEIEKEEKIRLESAIVRYKKQFDDFYNWQIEAREGQLSRGEGIANILKADIKRLEDEYEQKKHELNQSNISVSMKELLVCNVEVT